MRTKKVVKRLNQSVTIFDKLLTCEQLKNRKPIRAFRECFDSRKKFFTRKSKREKSIKFRSHREWSLRVGFGLCCCYHIHNQFWIKILEEASKKKGAKPRRLHPCGSNKKPSKFSWNYISACRSCRVSCASRVAFDFWISYGTGLCRTTTKNSSLVCFCLLFSGFAWFACCDARK